MQERNKEGYKVLDLVLPERVDRLADTVIECEDWKLLIQPLFLTSFVDYISLY